MSETTARLRKLWANFECDESKMVVIPFGPDNIRVAPPTAPVWEALAAVFQHHGYKIRTRDTDSYNCRSIKGSTERSLHSFGIALDVNWNTNPFIDHAGNRKVRFSQKPTQDERAEDVRLGLADTDMTEAMIADVLKIRTADGKQALEWGGHWNSVKDSMHFEIDVGPADLERGIDPSTVVGLSSFIARIEERAETVTPVAEMESSTTVVPASGDRFVVIARDGLRLRGGPSTEFDVTRTVAAGTIVNVLSRQDTWALVDLEGDGKADGFMSFPFLRPADATMGPAAGASDMSTVAPVVGDITGLVTPEMVKQMFPAGTKLANIAANLPFVLAGLRSRRLGDRAMVLMALATIRAETEGFVPISEGISRFNTNRSPFDRYEGRSDLGNTVAGDGPRFKGRGYIQLTGRQNYQRIGQQVGSNLIENPELANDPATAGLILAQFLKNKDSAIRAALAISDLLKARKLVNGGSHGFDRFKDTYDRGSGILPR
ncbi:hypothetical protein V1291_004449 [Nitrobacteraceae bacterium AZCC 1564]